MSKLLTKKAVVILTKLIQAILLNIFTNY